MPTISGPPGRWEALGQALQRKRTKIDPSYRDRSVFARELGFNDRLIADLERARRHSYRDTTLSAIEMAYRLKEDAISRFLEGETDEIEDADHRPEPSESADADPQPVPEAPGWDGEIIGPAAPLREGEELRWRDESGRRTFELTVRGLSFEAGLEAGSAPEDVIGDLRRTLAVRVAQVSGDLLRSHTGS